MQNQSDFLAELTAIVGEKHVLSHADMGYSYRHSGADKELIFTSAVFEQKTGYI